MNIIKHEKILETVVNDGSHTYLRRSVDGERVYWRVQAGLDNRGNGFWVEIMDKEKEKELESEFERSLAEMN